MSEGHEATPSEVVDSAQTSGAQEIAAQGNDQQTRGESGQSNEIGGGARQEAFAQGDQYLSSAGEVQKKQPTASSAAQQAKPAATSATAKPSETKAKETQGTSQSTGSSQQHQKVPEIPRVTNLQPGSKGRNFESFFGLMEIDAPEMQDQDSDMKENVLPPEPRKKKVLVKLYKKQQAKIDEAENQKQVFDVVDHPNVITCIDRGMVEFRSHQYTYFIFPAYQADLFVVLSKTGRLPEPIARYYLKQLVDGLQAIQDKGFAHRNLKPKNLYIDAADNFNLKIADFVFASHLNENSKTFVGTIDYMSPEIHLKLPHEPGKADVFAVGVILFNMITGQAPFQKATREDKNYPTLIEDTTAFWKQVSGTLHPEISSLTPHFKSLIEFCLRLEPIERPLVSQFKFAAWVRGQTATKEEVLEEMTNRFRILKLIPRQQPSSQAQSQQSSSSQQDQQNKGEDKQSQGGGDQKPAYGHEQIFTTLLHDYTHDAGSSISQQSQESGSPKNSSAANQVPLQQHEGDSNAADMGLQQP